MVFALLNANPGPFVWPKTARDPGSQPSRGLIITALAPSESVSDALGRARRLNAARFRPFRLLLLDSQQLIELWPDGARLRHRRALLQGPIMRTSSALGDVAVQAPRRALFRRMFNDTTHPCSVQDAFHEHQWPGAESISIRMERPDARTVSRTVVDVDHDRLRLSYCDLKSSTVTTVTLVVADSMRPSECS
jgi:hypothetical protein